MILYGFTNHKRRQKVWEFCGTFCHELRELRYQIQGTTSSKSSIRNLNGTAYIRDISQFLTLISLKAKGCDNASCNLSVTLKISFCITAYTVGFLMEQVSFQNLIE